MDKIFDSSALSIVPMSDGMLFAYCQDKSENQMTVAYKIISFENGVVTNVTADFFAAAKFGARYRSFIMQTDNPVTCKTAYLPNGNIFIADSKGSAKILDDDAAVVWSGKLMHKNTVISDAAAAGNFLWCSYKDSGALVKYNLHTMRDELRLGGGRNAVISEPKGISIDGDTMMVCDAGKHCIFEINLKSYSMNTYHEFDEPVHQYVHIKSYEIVLLDSGIYLL